MSASTINDMLPALHSAGLLNRCDPVEHEPLSGGVSSDIFLMRPTGRDAFVVKRALAKLNVKDDWFADTGRNRAEQDWFAYVAKFAPAAVPRLLHRDDSWFAMEYLGEGFSPWKTALLAGNADPAVAREAGSLLGHIHRVSWGDPKVHSTFATTQNFRELRIQPYLVTTGRRVPALRAHFETEAERLGSTALALVHGDYSPKNMLVGSGRLVIVDAEVAWFGDPAFDSAFLLTHLHLKAALHPLRRVAFLGVASDYWTAYRDALGQKCDADLERRVAYLMLMLMLARVHGKSPVEYLSPKGRYTVTDFVTRMLPAAPATLTDVTAAWSVELACA